MNQRLCSRRMENNLDTEVDRGNEGKTKARTNLNLLIDQNYYQSVHCIAAKQKKWVKKNFYKEPGLA